MLKGAMQSGDKRFVAYVTKTGSFDSTEMTDDEMEAEYQSNTKLLPSRFNYQGKMVIVTNKSKKEIDPAVLSRFASVNFNLSSDSIFGMISSKMDDFEFKNQEVPHAVRKLVFDIMKENWGAKMKPNFRVYTTLCSTYKEAYDSFGNHDKAKKITLFTMAEEAGGVKKSED